MHEVLLRLEENIRPEEVVPRQIIFSEAEIDRLGEEMRAVKMPGEVRRRIEFFSSQFEFRQVSFSVLGQLLLVQRRIETWPCWLLVNSLAVPVYWVRGLHLTSLLYAGYWLNAIVSFVHWRRELGEKNLGLAGVTR